MTASGKAVSDPVVLADLGNTRLKYLVLDPERAHDTDPETAEISTHSVEVAHIQDLSRSNVFPEEAIAGADWLIASVNPSAHEALHQRLQGGLIHPRRVRWLRNASELSLRHRLTTPETTGVDRALMVLRIQARRERERLGSASEPSRASAVVACGTAVTVERIEPDGTWAGGAIFPGLQLLARTLHNQTAQLPEIFELPECPERLGNSTRTAIQAGLHWGLLGAIAMLIQPDPHASGSTTRPLSEIIVAGGDAHRVAHGLKEILAQNPNPMGQTPRINVRTSLVLEGLWTCWRDNRIAERVRSSEAVTDDD